MGQNSAETQCRGLESRILESRCRGFSALESRCRGFLALEPRCRGFLVLESRCRVYVPPLPRFRFH